jgi:hypothetical protein
MQDKDCTQYVMDMHRIRESSLKSTNTKFNENIETRVKTQATPLK